MQPDNTEGVPFNAPEMESTQEPAADFKPNIPVLTKFSNAISDEYHQTFIPRLARSIRNVIDQEKTNYLNGFPIYGESMTPFINELHTNQNGFVEKPLAQDPILNQDQVQLLEKNRPGLNLPKYVRHQTAKALVADYDEEAYRQYILNNDNSYFNTIAQKAGGLIGSLADPIATGAAALVSRAIPEGGAETEALVHTGEDEVLKGIFGRLRGSISNSLRTTIGRQAVKGAAEMAAFTGTQESAKALEDYTNGDSFHPLDAAMDMTENMILGAYLHPLGSFLADKIKGRFFNKTQFASDDDAMDIAQTAHNQMINGKPVDIELPMKKAFINASQRLKTFYKANGLTDDQMLSSLDEIRDNINNEYESNQKIIDDLEKNKERSPDQEEQLNNFKDRQKLLEESQKSQEVHRALINNDQEDITKDDLSAFINYMKDPKTDFGESGTQTLDVTGAPVKDIENLMNDRFPDEAKKALLEEFPLSDIENQELAHVQARPERQKLFRSEMEKMIKCITGSMS